MNEWLINNAHIHKGNAHFFNILNLHERGEDYLLHEINHNMFHFQIKLLRMIYVFTTQSMGERERRKIIFFKKTESEAKMRRKKNDKKFLESFFFCLSLAPKHFSLSLTHLIFLSSFYT